MILVLSANLSSETAILKCIHVLILQIYSAADPTPSHLFTSPHTGPGITLVDGTVNFGPVAFLEL